MMQSEKQGYLGNFDDKTTEEIKALLKRQDDLARNRKFIARLSDKGEKIKQFIEKLKSELKQREKIDETADLFHKMALTAEMARRSNATGDCDTGDGLLSNIVNTSCYDKKIVDERIEGGAIVHNNYERVINKSQGKPQHRAKFFAHRLNQEQDVKDITKELNESMGKEKRDLISLDCTVISNTSAQKEQAPTELRHERMETQTISSDLDQSLSGTQKVGVNKVTDATNKATNDSIYSHKTLQDMGVSGKTCDKLKYRYDEHLEMSTYRPPLRHTGAQLIHLQDSMGLLKEQTQKLEKLQADQAADKLASRLGIGLVNPEGSALKQYREVCDTDSEESFAESNDEQDYPD